MNTPTGTMDDARAAWEAAVDIYAAHAAATFAELRAAFEPSDYAEDDAHTMYADATPEQVAGDVFDAVRRMVSGGADLHDLAQVFDDLARAAWQAYETPGKNRDHAVALATAYTRAAGMARWVADNPGGYAGAVVPSLTGADGKGGAS